MAVRLCYKADVKFAGFRSQLEASHVSSHEIVCLWMKNIHIYIYIYITNIILYIYMYIKFHI